MVARNAAGTHLPPLTLCERRGVNRSTEEKEANQIAVILAIITCGGLCSIATAKGKLLLAQNTFISQAPR